MTILPSDKESQEVSNQEFYEYLDGKNMNTNPLPQSIEFMTSAFLITFSTERLSSIFSKTGFKPRFA
jgi:hypothetical protein